jgi:predicted DNA-binding transcriptional regulator AlpA
MRGGDKFSDHLAYPPRGMEVERAAAYVGLGRTKFLEMVEAGRMPKPVDLDGSPRWDRADLDSAFDDLKDRRRDPVKRDQDKLRELFPK